MTDTKKIYRVRVIETVSRECDYFVEAADTEEARTLAENGETVDSDTLDEIGVTSRSVIEEPEEIEE